MNTTTDRRTTVTNAFIEKAHITYHDLNGKDAPCHRCANITKDQKGFNL